MSKIWDWLGENCNDLVSFLKILKDTNLPLLVSGFLRALVAGGALEMIIFGNKLFLNTGRSISGNLRRANRDMLKLTTALRLAPGSK